MVKVTFELEHRGRTYALGGEWTDFAAFGDKKIRDALLDDLIASIERDILQNG